MFPLARHAGLLAGLMTLTAGVALAQDASPPAAGLVELIQAGRPFVVVTRKDALPLRPGDWSYPSGFDYWVAFEGRFTAESGIWSSDGLGFSVRGMQYHACPPNLDRSRFICGGAHSDGYRMDQPWTPRDHRLVVLETVLTFDDAGAVYLDGQEIGVITVPPAPY